MIGNIVFILSLCFCLLSPSSLVFSGNVPLKVERLNERTLAISSTTGNSRVLLVDVGATLVMIDTGWSPAVAGQIQQLAHNEFGKKDVSHVILTNSSILNSGGLSAFPGAVVIAHEDCRAELADRRAILDELLADRAEEFDGRVTRTEARIAGMDDDDPDRDGSLRWIEYCVAIAKDLRLGYEIVLPQIAFREYLSLDVGDLQIELIHFGPTYAQGDILVLVAKAGVLFLGDIFHAHHALPYDMRKVAPGDVDNWLASLDFALDPANTWSQALRCNGDGPWSRQTVELRRTFIADILRLYRQAQAEGETLESVLSRLASTEQVTAALPVVNNPSGGFSEMKDLVAHDVRSLIKALWCSEHDSSAEVLYQTLLESGVEAARKRFHVLQKDTTHYHLEAEFNRLGYRLLGQQHIPLATALFKMGLEIYPEASNLYDSLGESLLAAGSQDEAIASYRRSLELDPANENAREVLARLEQE